MASWVAQGIPWGDEKLHKPVAVKVSPKDTVLPKGESQQLLARAVYADGSERNVTRLASFARSDPTVTTVDPSGRIKAEGFGEAVVRATFMRRSDTVRVAHAAAAARLSPRSRRTTRSTSWCSPSSRSWAFRRRSLFG